MTFRHASDLDSPWKEALEHFLPQFLDFFFPPIHRDLDWSRGYQSLDKELHQIVRGAKVGRRLADKLFKVWRNDGEETWLLIHVEVQGRPEKKFAERMFVYNYRVFDRYRRPVVSLAALCDEQSGWKPEHFGYNMWGCDVGIHFLVAKLLEYQEREQELESSRNPFAAVVLAQLKAMQTKSMPQERRVWKVRLIKGLYERGLKAEEIRQLFRLIDWMLTLPEELEESFREDVYRFEEERTMPYISSVERFGIKKGLQEGLEQGRLEGLRESITMDLEVKFGAVNKRLMKSIEAIKEISELRKVARAVKQAKTVEEIRSALRP